MSTLVRRLSFCLQHRPMVVKIDTSMKMTDKDAITQVKEILENCSPAARQAIQSLLSPSLPKPPAARSMNKEELKIAPPMRRVPKVYDESKEHPAVATESGDGWLDNWIR